MHSASAQRFTSDSLSIAYSTTGVTTTTQLYYGKGGTPVLGGASGGGLIASGIDPFNSAGTLAITSIGDRLNPSGTTAINSSFYYRVYLQGTSLANMPTYTKVVLNGSVSNNTSKAIYGSSQSIDLLTTPRNTGGGTYVLDVYYDFNWQDGGDAGTVNDKASGPSTPYSATFTVAAPINTPTGSVTTWQSTTSTAWFLASNWSNGVPTATSDAIIPENTQGTNIIFPVLNSLARPYRVRNLTLNGTTNSGRAQITIQQAVLRVYGNIQQLSGGLVGTNTGNVGVLDSTQNSRLVLLGSNQFITGRLSVPDVIVSGTGIKSVANELRPTNILAFVPTTSSGVIVQSASSKQNADGTTSYVFDTTGNSLINLGSTGSISSEVIGRETNVSYIKGIASASRPLQLDGNGVGIQETFGNIGLDFTPNHTATLVTVQRIIGDPLLGPTTPSPRVTPVPIKRQYSISGDDNSGSVATAGSSNDVVFHYLDSEYELNTIMEPNLTMFRTNTGAAPYTPLGGNLDQTANTVSLVAQPSLPNYFLTLGDKTNPLPVSLVAFTATRTSNDAVLNWVTASEKHNTGFEVQVSTDGATFRKLAFIASQNPNSNQKLVYTYTDTEIAKSGVRYYRLRQIDTDETEAFSPVRAVSFSGAASAATALAGYPNPFTNKLDFNLDATTVGNGVANIQLVDMTGRIVLEQTMKVANASLTLTGLDGLRSGLYLAKVTLPDGTVQKVRVQKQ